MCQPFLSFCLFCNLGCFVTWESWLVLVIFTIVHYLTLVICSLDLVIFSLVKGFLSFGFTITEDFVVHFKLRLRIYKDKFCDLLLCWCLLLFSYYELDKWLVWSNLMSPVSCLLMLLVLSASVFLLISIMSILDHLYIYVKLTTMLLHLIV